MSLFALTGYGLCCAAVYHLFPKKLRYLVLLAASYGFYAANGLAGLPFILATTAATYLAALRIGAIAASLKGRLQGEGAQLTREEKRRLRAQAKSRQRAWLIAALALCFGLLAVLKYADDVLGWFGGSPLGLVLPLGISFYTFQSTGYLIDVYNGKYPPERHPLRYALFVSFFPQLIQGPIGRYDQLSEQLSQPHDFDWDGSERGVLLILWGLFKKMVIADRALPLVEQVFSAPMGAYGGAAALVAVLFYAVQQYTDFSGGIDLVAGIAELFGIRLAPNFKRPYFSVSLGDFWRRWHISLGSWMRDYVFYPFALTRPVTALSKAVKRVSAPLARALPAVLGNLLVFLLVGVWHGATANYIAWGLYNGVLLAISAALEPAYKAWNAKHARLSASKGFYVARVLRTFVIVNIGWFFDRCARAGDALRMMASVVTDFRPAQLAGGALLEMGVSAVDLRVLAVAVAALFAVSVLQERGVVLRDWVVRRPMLVRWFVLIGGVVCVLLLGVWGSGFNEAAFLYYQF